MSDSEQEGFGDGRFSRHALKEGTAAHYTDGELYDQTYRRRRHDAEWYALRSLIHGGPVLELGVGTGRIAFAIADRGVNVLGVDRMPEMLARARERLSKQKRRVRDRVVFAQGDLMNFRVDRKFKMVIAPFNVLMHVYTREEWEAAMETVRTHLEDEGVFLLDVLMPDLRYLARTSERVYQAGKVKRPDTGRRYHYRERFDYDDVSQVQLVEMSYEAVDDPNDAHVAPLAHRYFYPAELEALLHYNGFEVLERYGDFDELPLDGESESQVIVARLRPR